MVNNGMIWELPNLVMTNISPWFVHGPNRNRWFTVLKNGGFSMAMLNNQTVSDFLYDISREYLELYKLLLLYILLLLICNRLLITFYDLFDDLGIASRMIMAFIWY